MKIHMAHTIIAKMWNDSNLHCEIYMKKYLILKMFYTENRSHCIENWLKN